MSEKVRRSKSPRMLEAIEPMPLTEPCIAFVEALARWAVRIDLLEAAIRDPNADRRNGAFNRTRTIDLVCEERKDKDST